MGSGELGTGRLGRSALVLACLSVVARCSVSEDALMERAASGGGSFGDASAPCFGPSCSGGGGTSGGGGLPPEQEVESSFRSPVATGQYVWTANPLSGRVARVDAKSLEVRTV